MGYLKRFCAVVNPMQLINCNVANKTKNYDKQN